MLKAYFQTFHYDQDYSYLWQSRRRRSRSFVQNFLKLHYIQLDQGVTLSATNIAGSNVTLSSNNEYYAIKMLCTAPGRGGAGHIGRQSSASGGALWSSSTNNGIVVGTGTTAVAPTDYALTTQIADGTSSGQLEHFPCGGTEVTTSGSTASFTLERLFRNSSGGTITINEIGIYACWNENSGFGTSNQAHFCIVRDLVSPGFDILNGNYARIVYTMSVTA